MLEEAKNVTIVLLGKSLIFSVLVKTLLVLRFFILKYLAFKQLTDYMSSLWKSCGYQEVKTPLVLSEKLWQRSGHYDNYLENMFFTKTKSRAPNGDVELNQEEERPMALKPMNFRPCDVVCKTPVLLSRSALRVQKWVLCTVVSFLV